MMRSLPAMEINATGVAHYYVERYPGLLDATVIDVRDAAQVSATEALGLRVRAAQTIMPSESSRESLARVYLRGVLGVQGGGRSFVPAGSRPLRRAPGLSGSPGLRIFDIEKDELDGVGVAVLDRVHGVDRGCPVSTVAQAGDVLTVSGQMSLMSCSVFSPPLSR